MQIVAVQRGEGNVQIHAHHFVEARIHHDVLGSGGVDGAPGGVFGENEGDGDDGSHDGELPAAVGLNRQIGFDFGEEVHVSDDSAFHGFGIFVVVGGVEAVGRFGGGSAVGEVVCGVEVGGDWALSHGRAVGGGLLGVYWRFVLHRGCLLISTQK